jgi:DNA-binding PadR family transcriptional regulator
MDARDLPYGEAALLCILNETRIPDDPTLPLWFGLLACSFDMWDLARGEAEEALGALVEKGLVEPMGCFEMEPRANYRLYRLTEAGESALTELLPPRAQELAEQYAADDIVTELRALWDRHVERAEYEQACVVNRRLEAHLVRLAREAGHPIPSFERFSTRKLWGVERGA